jgi:hypothetical protein
MPTGGDSQGIGELANNITNLIDSVLNSFRSNHTVGARAGLPDRGIEDGDIPMKGC